MIRIKILTVFVFFGMLSLQSQTNVTLQECRQEALELNKSLDLARMDVQYAQAMVKSARTNYLPKIDGSGSVLFMPNFDGVSIPGFFLPTAESAQAAEAGNFSGNSDAYFPGINMGMDNLKLYIAEISAEQPIFAGNRIRLGNQMADVGVDIAREALLLTSAEVTHAVDKAFWNLVAVQEHVQVLNSYVVALDSLEAQLKMYYELGLLPRSEYLKVSVQRNEVRLQLLEVNNMAQLAGMNLARITGKPLDMPLVAVTDNYNFDSSIQNISVQLNFTNRSELRILQNQTKLAQLERKSIAGEYMPQIGVSAGYRYIDGPNLMSGNWNLTLGAGISIPIVHWRDKKHRTNMARIKEMKSEVTFKDSYEQISLEVQQNVFNLQTAIVKVDVARENLEQADETMAEVEISFNAGINNITDVLNARVGWQRASASLVEAKANLEIVKSAYMKSVGLL